MQGRATLSAAVTSMTLRNVLKELLDHIRSPEHRKDHGRFGRKFGYRSLGRCGFVLMGGGLPKLSQRIVGKDFMGV